MIRTILVAHDFSSHAERALEYGVALAKGLGAKLHILHAYRVQADINLPGDLWAQVEEEASRRLAKVTGCAESDGLEVETHLSQRHPVQAIPDTAAEIEADLIIMGTRGHTGWRHVILGSVAERTIRSAPCSVLTVKASDG
jgi:nucleotide-binding universal stress UspA family protein